MRALILVCHPVPNSLNHAIAGRCRDAAAAASWETAYIDLYRKHATAGFDPVLSLEEIRRRFSFDEAALADSRKVAEADVLVFVHPDWWGMPPALLKGWLDRIFRPGIAYDYDGPEFMPKNRIPLLGKKRAMVICTTDRRKTDGDDTSSHPLETLWRDSILGYCGMTDVRFELFWNVHDSTHRERRAWLDHVTEVATRLFQIAPDDGGNA